MTTCRVALRFILLYILIHSFVQLTLGINCDTQFILPTSLLSSLCTQEGIFLPFLDSHFIVLIASHLICYLVI